MHTKMVQCIKFKSRYKQVHKNSLKFIPDIFCFLENLVLSVDNSAKFNFCLFCSYSTDFRHVSTGNMQILYRDETFNFHTDIYIPNSWMTRIFSCKRKQDKNKAGNEKQKLVV